MADGAVRLLVAWGGSELLGVWVAAGSRPRTPGWWKVRSAEVVGCQGVALSYWGAGLLLDPGWGRRDGGGG